jgi:hypothetical protein
VICSSALLVSGTQATALREKQLAPPSAPNERCKSTVE